MSADDLIASVGRPLPLEEKHIRRVLRFAEATGRKSLRVMCMIWLDPVSPDAKEYAESEIRSLGRRFIALLHEVVEAGE